MKFLNVTLDNFMTLGMGASLMLNDRGLNLIEGVNNDDSSAGSNGAGKSSIVDGLCWCLWGVTARGSKGDKIVNSKAPKGQGARVQVLMRNETGVFRITRYRKHPTHKNQLHIESSTGEGALWEPLHKGTEAESQKVIERLLGCSYEVFVAAVYAGQEQMPDLPNMTDGELKRIIEEAAGMQRLEKAFGIAKARRLTADLAFTLVNEKLKTAHDDKASTEAQTEAVDLRVKAWDAERAERVDVALHAATSAADVEQVLLAQITEWTTEKEELQARAAEIGKSLSAHKAQAAGVTELNNAAAGADKAIERHALQAAVKAVKAIEADLADAPAAMAKPCEECGKPHTPDELDEFVRHLNLRLSAANAALGALKVKVIAQMGAAEVAKKAAAAAAAMLPDVSGLARSLATINEKLQTTARLDAALSIAGKNREAAELALVHRRSEVNPNGATLKMLHDRLAATASKIGDLQTQFDAASKKAAIADSVVKLYGPGGVRAQILDDVTPQLNARSVNPRPRGGRA